MSRTETERSVVESLYDAFADYRFDESTIPCAHCLPAEQEEVLRRAPLRRLTIDQLRGVAADLPEHWGTTDDLRYFLPRLLDILLDGDFAHPDLAVVAARLAHCEWRRWPSAEQRALSLFFDAKWDRLARGLDVPHSAAALITMSACAGLDVHDCLDRWLSDSSDDGFAVIADLVASESQLPDGLIVDPHWPDDVPRTLVADWLVTAPVKAALEDARHRGVAWSWHADVAATLIGVSTWADAARRRLGHDSPRGA